MSNRQKFIGNLLRLSTMLKHEYSWRYNPFLLAIIKNMRVNKHFHELGTAMKIIIIMVYFRKQEKHFFPNAKFTVNVQYCRYSSVKRLSNKYIYKNHKSDPRQNKISNKLFLIDTFHPAYA